MERTFNVTLDRRADEAVEATWQGSVYTHYLAESESWYSLFRL